MGKKKAAIFDVDGTLCDVRTVRHYVLQPKGEKDFHLFHEESTGCPPNADVVKAVHKYKQLGYEIIIVTARSWEWYHHTLWWLLLNEIPFDQMYMRPIKDMRKDYIIKKEILAEIRKNFNPVIAYDDNPAILQLWAEEGIPAIKIEGWLYDNV